MESHVTIHVQDLQQDSSQVSDEAQQDSHQVSLDIGRLLTPNHPSGPVRNQSPGFLQDFIQRCFEFLLLDRSIRRVFKFLVLLEILVQKMMKEDERAVIFLRCLQSQILVSKYPIIGACLSRRRRKTTTIDEEHHEIISETLSQNNHEIEEEEGKTEDERNDQEVEKVEEEKDKAVKNMSEWWVNTRNIMATVAILFITLSLTASFTPPVGVLDGNIFGIFFIIAMNVCFMVSVAVLFFLFGITASSQHIEKRTLQISNAGLWISLFTLMVAYIANIWLMKIHVALRVWLTIITPLWFLLLFSFFSRRMRSKSHGRKLFQETDTDVKPFILTEI